MKIIVAEHYGLCFGVRDAIAKAEQLAAAGPLTILGELVHNPIVRHRLKASGADEASLEAPPAAPGTQVMITAHGASDKDRARFRTSGLGVADGTCPLVRHAHDQLRMLVSLGYFPVIIGKRGHVEVRGLTGDFPQAFVLQDIREIPEIPVQSKIGVIAQTTQPIESVQNLVGHLRKQRPEAEVRFADTVCRPTKDRQKALETLLLQVDVVVVVGGRNSNNTRQLVEKSRAAGKPAHHVEGPDDLRVEWIAGADTVGLTAGTSTLKETVEAVRLRLLELAQHRNCKAA